MKLLELLQTKSYLSLLFFLVIVGIAELTTYTPLTFDS